MIPLIGLRVESGELREQGSGIRDQNWVDGLSTFPFP
jgi:hypothetical protein